MNKFTTATERNHLVIKNAFLLSFLLKENESSKEKFKAAETMPEHIHLFGRETNSSRPITLLVTGRDSDSVSRSILCDENVPGVSPRRISEALNIGGHAKRISNKVIATGL